MHSRRLIDLAARIAITAPRHVRIAGRLSPTGCHDYWRASTDRFTAWSAALAPFTPGRGTTPARFDWHAELRPLLEEIFTGELLARVWTAVGTAHAREHQHADVEPTLRGVLLKHLELRNQALECVVFGAGGDVQQVECLQQVRRRVERWTDLLFGEMQRSLEVAEFAHDPRRAREYARMSPPGPARDSDATADQELLRALQNDFAAVLGPSAAFPELNQRLATSILNGFQGDWLEAIEWSPQHWRTRLRNTSQDTLLWIDDLLKLDAPRPRRESESRQGRGEA